MSYQALARKWRPRSFDDMVGQQHVVRALANALDRDQLHHAYLFAGTRGVGKTTLARILSKALNCEVGVSSRPCGVCAACRELDGGRFVDLLEVDAASRTKVEQTRELLENVPYAPVRARFKVYLIDEVHMFSSHSFNALLKTLEEPPAHVKFLLATTDPQKVPVTVLSRCLQFNLRRLLPGEIAGHLRHVLTVEGIDFESTALLLLARAADGSMRDGLSLLDQAIAFGGGRVIEEEVRTMLGTVSGEVVFDLLDALAIADGARLLTEIERVAAMTPDFAELLRELIAVLHRIALIQQVPGILAADDADQLRLAALATAISAADVQLYYQVALTGQRDLPLAPDPRSGFEMVLLRALAFRPASHAGDDATHSGDATRLSPAPRPAVREKSDAGAERPLPDRQLSSIETTLPDLTPRVPSVVGASPPASPTSAPAVAPVSYPTASMETPALNSAADWQQLVSRLPLRGIPSQLAHHCGFLEWANGRLALTLDQTVENLRIPSAETRLREALEQRLGAAVKLEIQVTQSHQDEPRQETLAQRLTREADARQRAAVETLRADPLAEQLRERFDADWTPGSIAPTD